MSLLKSKAGKLPDTVENLIPDVSAKYRRAKDIEKKLDHILKTRLVILQEQKSVSLYDRSKARIKVSVTASFELETPALSGLEDELGVPLPANGTMMLKITGSRVDTGVQDLQKSQVPIFTSYFDKVGARISGVDFKQPISPVWDRFSETERNGLHAKLKTLGPINAQVFLKPRYPLYELKDRLLLVPGNRRVDSLENVIKNVWSHVKRFQLQDPLDCRVIRCDTILQAALGARVIAFGQLRDRLLSNMKKHDYIAREFTFGYDWETLEHEQSFEFEVGMSSEMQFGSSGVNALVKKMEKDVEQIKLVDTKIGCLFDELSESVKRYKLYTDFHEKPVEFLEKWMTSQRHDFGMIDNALLAEKYGSTFSNIHRRSEFYQSAPEVSDSVLTYLKEKDRSAYSTSDV